MLEALKTEESVEALKLEKQATESNLTAIAAFSSMRFPSHSKHLTAGKKEE